MPAVHAVCARRFFFASSLATNTGNRQSSTCNKRYTYLRLSPAHAVHAAGAGHSIHPFPIQPHHLFPHIMVGTELPSSETFKGVRKVR